MSTETTGAEIEVRRADIAPLKSELPAISEEFALSYPALSPDIDIDAALREALGEGAQIRLSDLTRIKVPSSELDRIMVPDETGRPQPVDELVVVPVGMTARRSWWVEDVPSGKAPDCSSRDLITGVGRFGINSAENPSGKCETCPMAVPGSANKGTMASACKEQRLLFLLSGEELLPYVLVVPPASLTGPEQFHGYGITLFKKGVRGYLRGYDEMGVEVRGLSWSGVELGISLAQDVNKAGQRYNKLKFRTVRKLNSAERQHVDLVARFVEKLIEQQAKDLDLVQQETAGNFAADRSAEHDEDLTDDGAPLDDLDDEVTPSAGRKR